VWECPCDPHVVSVGRKAPDKTDARRWQFSGIVRNGILQKIISRGYELLLRALANLNEYKMHDVCPKG